MQRTPTTPTPESRERLHPWERAGLGRAPFRFVGTERFDASHPSGMRVIASNGYSETLTKPGTCCDYCLTYIVEAFWIRSADGRRFKVGCDCVAKVSAPGDRILSDVDRARRKLARDKRKARGAATKAALEAELCRPEVRRVLSAKPHPSEWAAEKGMTLLDYVEWMLDRAGVSGVTKAAKLVRAEVSK